MKISIYLTICRTRRRKTRRKLNNLNRINSGMQLVGTAPPHLARVTRRPSVRAKPRPKTRSPITVQIVRPRRPMD